MQRDRVWLVLGLAGLMVGHAVAVGPLFPIDDAYITLHNADALTLAEDPRFPGVQALVGCTSLLHVVLIRVLATALPTTAAQFVAMWLALILFALALHQAAEDAGTSRWVAVLLSVLGLLGGHAALHLVNGLETGLALACATWLFVLSRREEATERLTKLRVVRGLLMGALPFIRPDLAPVSAVAWLWPARVLGQPLRMQRLWKDAAAALVVVAPCLVWQWSATGSFIPQTLDAKRLFFAEACGTWWQRGEVVGAALWEWSTTTAFVPVLLVGLATRSRTGWMALAAFGLWLVPYLLQLPGALFHNNHRYLVPLLGPFWVALLDARVLSIPRVRPATVGLLLVLCLSRLYARYHEYTAGILRTIELDDVVTWFDKQVPQGARILAHDIGYLSQVNRGELIDAVGLKRPASRDVHREMTWSSCGQRRGEAIAVIAKQTHPDYVVVILGWDGLFGITRGLLDNGFKLALVRGPNPDYAVFKVLAP